MLPVALPLTDEYEVLLPDMPGHGRSHGSRDALPDLAQLFEFTARWIDGLETKPDFVVGHSLGAWLLLELLRRRRIAPRAAALIAPAVGALDGDCVQQPPAKLPSRINESALRKELVAFAAAEGGGPVSPVFVDAVGRSLLRHPRSYSGLHGQLRRALSGPPPRVRLGCSTLVVTGSADRVCLLHRVERLVDASAGTSLHVLEGAGHMPFACDAGPIVGPIRAFFSSVARG
jgi:pimeloyl-ACP methyl ester carboxylesterase